MKNHQVFIKDNFLTICICTISVSILFFFFQPRSYEASISIYPSYQNSSGAESSLLSLASDFGIGSNLNTNAVIYTPDIVDSFLLKKSILQKQYDSLNNKILLDYLIDSEWIQIGEIDYELKLKQYADRLDDHIFLIVDRVSGLITINTYFESKELSAEICDFIYTYLQKFINQSSISIAEAKIQYYDKRLDEVSSNLKKSEKELENFLIDNKDINSPILQTTYLRYLRNVELNNQVYSMLRQQIENEKIQLKKDELNFVISDKYVNPKEVKISWRLLLLANFFLLSLLYIYSFYHRSLTRFFSNQKRDND
tara:strand:+ start:3867 stop:4799 length:933 start_codon:yes stop_codon:yes gene_type:complete